MIRVAKYPLRCLASALGFSVRRKGAIARTMRDALLHLKAAGYSPASVIDVGVASGTPDLYAVYGESQYLLVEPLAEFKPALERLMKRLHAIHVPAAAGDRDGVVDLYVHDDRSASSSRREVDDSDVTATLRTVPMHSLDTLIDRHRMVGPFLLKVDVQGAELDVLRGARRVLDEGAAVILEVSFFRFMEGAPDIAEVIAWMKGAGYAAYDVFGGHFRPADGALAQLDILFVPEHSPLRAYHGYRVEALRRS